MLADMSASVDKLVYPRGTGDWVTPNGSLSTSTSLIRKIELYVNNIFCNPEVHAIYIKRIGFSLIRVHRQQTFSAQNAVDSVLLQQLKWPIETIFTGMKLEDYVSSVDAVRRANLDKWCKFSEVVASTYQDDGFYCYKKEVLTGTTVAIDVSINVGRVTGVGTDFDGTVATGPDEILPGDFLVVNGVPYAVQAVTGPTVLELGDGFQALPNADVAATADFYKFTRVPKSCTVTRDVPTIDTLSVVAHGISLILLFAVQMIVFLLVPVYAKTYASLALLASSLHTYATLRCSFLRLNIVAFR